jgi:hypothetical protein
MAVLHEGPIRKRRTAPGFGHRSTIFIRGLHRKP